MMNQKLKKKLLGDAQFEITANDLAKRMGMTLLQLFVHSSLSAERKQPSEDDIERMASEAELNE